MELLNDGALFFPTTTHEKIYRETRNDVTREIARVIDKGARFWNRYPRGDWSKFILFAPRQREALNRALDEVIFEEFFIVIKEKSTDVMCVVSVRYFNGIGRLLPFKSDLPYFFITYKCSVFTVDYLYYYLDYVYSVK